MEPAVYEQFYRVERDHWWFAGMRAIFRGVLSRGMDRGGPARIRCLDIGCGTGLWTKEMETFGTVWGLDVAPEALRFCRLRGLRRLVQASAERLPFVEGTFGLITALGVIEHLDEDGAFMRELYRVCAPGAHVVLLTSAYRFLWSQHDVIVHHRRRYTRGEVRRLAETAGFEVVQSSYVNTLLFPPIAGIRMVQRVIPRPARPEAGTPDLFVPPAPVNWLLYAALWIEAQLLNLISFPFGVGLYLRARKPA